MVACGCTDLLGPFELVVPTDAYKLLKQIVFFGLEYAQRDLCGDRGWFV